MHLFTFPLGAPAWRFAARCGVPVSITVDIVRDEQAGVYVATSRNVKGFVVEAESLDGIKDEAIAALLELLPSNYPILDARPKQTSLCFNTCLA